MVSYFSFILSYYYILNILNEVIFFAIIGILNFVQNIREKSSSEYYRDFLRRFFTDLYNNKYLSK